jgi:LmbE family N-acetylglucosaminyl deacetylase
MASVLHVSPHPDDELIGPPAALMGLRDAGHRIVNLACGVGSLSQRERRRHELDEAMRRARFDLIVHDPPLAISSGDDLATAQRILTGTIRDLLEPETFDVVVSPQPHDGHHAHELVGRAVRDAIAGLPAEPPAWWMWGLWADLPLPTLYIPFDDDRLAEIVPALRAYSGEIERNDYTVLVRARGEANRVLGSERVFGLGGPERTGPYAELLTEALRVEGRWMLGAARTPAFDRPLDGASGKWPIDWWLYARSVADQMRSVRSEADAADDRMPSSPAPPG